MIYWIDYDVREVAPNKPWEKKNTLNSSSTGSWACCTWDLRKLTGTSKTILTIQYSPKNNDLIVIPMADRIRNHPKHTSKTKEDEIYNLQRLHAQTPSKGTLPRSILTKTILKLAEYIKRYMKRRKMIYNLSTLEQQLVVSQPPTHFWKNRLVKSGNHFSPNDFGVKIKNLWNNT